MILVKLLECHIINFIESFILQQSIFLSHLIKQGDFELQGWFQSFDIIFNPLVFLLISVKSIVAVYWFHVRKENCLQAVVFLFLLGTIIYHCTLLYYVFLSQFMIAIIIVLFTPFAAGKLLHVGLILGYSALFLLGSFCNKWQKNLSLNERDLPDALTTI